MKFTSLFICSRTFTPAVGEKTTGADFNASPFRWGIFGEKSCSFVDSLSAKTAIKKKLTATLI
jgi:hypothetical protein